MSKNFFVMLIVIISFVGLFIFGNVHYQNKIAETNKQAQAMMSQRIEQEEQANRDLYTKLANGKRIRTLVVSNVPGFNADPSTKQIWQQQLHDQIAATYDSNVVEHQIIAPALNVFNGLFTYEQNKTDEEQDLVIFMFDSSQLETLTPVQFQKSYERLVTQVIIDQPTAEVLLFITNDLNHHPTYVEVVEELATYYQLPLVNGGVILSNAVQSMEDLTEEDGYPNEIGNQLYAKAIFDVISENVTQNKVIDYSDAEAFTDISGLDAFQFISEPEETTGFQLKDGYYVSDKENDSIRYAFSGEALALHFDNAGGQLEVYLDGEYYQPYNINEQEKGEQYLFITDDLDQGNHVVQLFVREEGKPIIIKGIVAW